jgi:hypothetical protein
LFSKPLENLIVGGIVRTSTAVLFHLGTFMVVMMVVVDWSSSNNDTNNLVVSAAVLVVDFMSNLSSHATRDTVIEKISNAVDDTNGNNIKIKS